MKHDGDGRRFTGDWSVATERGRTTPVDFDELAHTREEVKHRIKARARRLHPDAAFGAVHVSIDEEGRWGINCVLEVGDE